MAKILEVMSEMTLGGAETLVRNLIKNKTDLESVDILIHSDANIESEYNKEIKNIGVNFYYVPRFKVYNYLDYKRAIKHFFNSHNDYDVVHGHIESCAFIYLKVAKQHNISTIVHSHNSKHGKGIEALLKKYFYFRMRKYADYFMSCSYDASIDRFGKKIANTKALILNNGVDFNIYKYDERNRKQVRDLYNVGESEFVLGTISRIVPDKNIDFLFDLVEKLNKKNISTTLIVVGNGDKEYVNKLKLLKEQLKFKDKIIFTGETTNTSIFYSCLDVFCLPSHLEGLPLSLVEASVNGLPCLIAKHLGKELDLSYNVLRANIYGIEAKNDWVNAIEDIYYKIKYFKKRRNVIPENLAKFDIVKNSKLYWDFIEKISR